MADVIRRKRRVGKFLLELTHYVPLGDIRIVALDTTKPDDEDNEEGRMEAFAIPRNQPLESARSLSVAGAYAYAGRGARLGTRMYEMMAEYGCEQGFPLASDIVRSKAGESFWRKQYEKGRATHECSRDSFRTRGEPCAPDERVYAKDGREVLKSQYPAKVATRYQLKTCPAPTSLEGLKRRKKRK